MRTRAGEPGLRLSLDDTILHLRLADGRSADVPPAAFERLRKAPRDQLENWEIIGECEGVNWPDIDDEISIKDSWRTASGTESYAAAARLPKKAGRCVWAKAYARDKELIAWN